MKTKHMDSQVLEKMCRAFVKTIIVCIDLTNVRYLGMTSQLV